MATSIFTANFGNLLSGNILLSNIVVTDTDVLNGIGSSIFDFITSGPFVLPETDGFGLSGVNFTSFAAGVVGPDVSQTVVFTYSVSSTTAASASALNASTSRARARTGVPPSMRRHARPAPRNAPSNMSRTWRVWAKTRALPTDPPRW